MRLHLVHDGLDPRVFAHGFDNRDGRVAQPERYGFSRVYERLHLTPAVAHRVRAADGPLDGEQVELVDAELLEHRVARRRRVGHLARRDLRADVDGFSSDARRNDRGDGCACVDEVLIARRRAASHVPVPELEALSGVRRVHAEHGQAAHVHADAQGDVAFLLGRIVDGLGWRFDVVRGSGGWLGGIAAGRGSVPGAVAGVGHAAVVGLGELAEVLARGRRRVGRLARGARALKLHLPGHHLGDLARSAAGWARAAGRRGLRFELRARGRVRRERGVVSVDVAGHGVRALLVGPAADAAHPGVGAAVVLGRSRRRAERPRLLRAAVLGEGEALHRLAPVLRHGRWSEGVDGKVGGAGPPRASEARARVRDVDLEFGQEEDPGDVAATRSI